MSRAPRKADARSLENAALHYLGRFASSAESLRRVLLRRVRRSAAAHGTDAEAGAALVEALIARFRTSGLLDDDVYVAARTASLRRRGTSRRGIAMRLAQKGVDADAIAAALADSGDDLGAACALVRRRRLGPCRPPETRAAFRERDLATLARAGFALDLARRALACRDADELDALERGD